MHLEIQNKSEKFSKDMPVQHFECKILKNYY